MAQRNNKYDRQLRYGVTEFCCAVLRFSVVDVIAYGGVKQLANFNSW